MKSKKLTTGTRVEFDFGFSKGVTGTVLASFRHGSHGLSYDIRLDKAIMVFGKMSYTINLYRHEIKKVA